MKKLNQIIWILFFGLNLSGQSVWIDSIYSNPLSPTIEDTIWVIGEIGTASAGCDLISTELEIDEINKVIEITACYAIGSRDTICTSIDTFLIGQLQEGEYSLILKTKGFETIVNPNGDCSNSTNETEKEFEILVRGTNSTESKSEQLFQFDLIENPANNYATFQIRSIDSKLDLMIFDNLGRKVVQKRIENNH